MKNRNCTNKDSCWDYDASNCEGCSIGEKITAQARQIKRLRNRLAELEDKIERGELVEVPKGAVVLTPEERAEEMRLCNEERKEIVKECLLILHNIGGCGATDAFWVGWDEAINAAFKEISQKYGISVNEVFEE